MCGLFQKKKKKEKAWLQPSACPWPHTPPRVQSRRCVCGFPCHTQNLKGNPALGSDGRWLPTPNVPPLPSPLEGEGGEGGRALEASAHEGGSLPGTEGQGAAFGLKVWDVSQGGAGQLAGQREVHSAEQGGPRTGPRQVGVGRPLPALPPQVALCSIPRYIVGLRGWRVSVLA